MRYRVLRGMQLLDLSSSPLSIYIMVVREENIKGYFVCSMERWGSDWGGIKIRKSEKTGFIINKMMLALMSERCLCQRFSQGRSNYFFPQH